MSRSFYSVRKSLPSRGAVLRDTEQYRIGLGRGL